MSYFRLADVTQAEHYFSSAVSSAEQAEANDMILLAKTNLAVLYSRKHDFQRALALCKEVLLMAAALYSYDSLEVRYSCIDATIVHIAKRQSYVAGFTLPTLVFVILFLLSIMYKVIVMRILFLAKHHKYDESLLS